jgi:hypothetical protein
MATKRGPGSRPEKTGPEVAKIAGRALADPGSVTKAEIQKLAASVLTQVEKPEKPRPLGGYQVGKPKPR